MKNPDPNLLKSIGDTKDPKKLMQNLSEKDKETVNKMLKDEKALKELLASPQAQALMKMLSGKGKNG